MRVQFVISCLLMALIAGCVAPAPMAEETTHSAVEMRTIIHALGQTEVPAAPQRVVVLDTGEIDNALALGATVVGAPVGDVLQYQEYLAGQLDGITDIGAISEPNLETIVQLDPDLILGSKQRYEGIYDQLSAIAPTVFVESLRVPWQQNFRLHAEALGKTTEAEALLADYDSRTAQIRQALGEDLPTISIIRFRPGQVRLYLKSSYIGYILQDVGLPRPSAQDQDRFSSDISLEQIADVDADYLFVTGYAQDDSDLAKFLESELWTTLSAVQNGRVTDVDDDTWVAGLGVQAAKLVLDDLIAIFGLEIDQAAVETETFPVTIEHKFGAVTIPAEPLRVITLGFSEQDAVLALGVKPIAIREWFGNQPYAVWPWAQEELGDATPEVINMPFGQLNFEALAAMQPDLMVATHSGITAEEYEILAGIAPTFAQSGEFDDFGMPWQEQTRSIGQALGRSAQAEELINEVEAQIVAAAHPSFAGKTISWITPTEAPGEFWVTGQNTPPMRFLATLGFEFSAEVAELIGDQSSLRISSERLDLIDTTVLILRAPTQETLDAITADPLFQQLNAVKDKRVIYFVGDDPIYGALSFSTVDSLPYVIEQLVPKLVELTDR